MIITDYPELAGDIERKRRERKTWAVRAARRLAAVYRKGQRKWKR
jgi:hypothetical protein